VPGDDRAALRPERPAGHDIDAGLQLHGRAAAANVQPAAKRAGRERGAAADVYWLLGAGAGVVTGEWDRGVRIGNFRRPVCGRRRELIALVAAGDAKFLRLRGRLPLQAHPRLAVGVRLYGAVGVEHRLAAVDVERAVVLTVEAEDAYRSARVGGGRIHADRIGPRPDQAAEQIGRGAARLTCEDAVVPCEVGVDAARVALRPGAQVALEHGAGGRDRIAAGIGCDDAGEHRCVKRVLHVVARRVAHGIGHAHADGAD